MDYRYYYSCFTYNVLYRSDEECTTGSATDHLRSGSEPTITCNASCCNDATLYNPVHVTHSSILLKTKKLQGKKWRQFNSEWFKMYPLLVLCTTRLKAFCSYCGYSNKRGLITEKRGRQVLCNTGFDYWKKAHETFSQHQ